jgi:hypothetical protein
LDADLQITVVAVIRARQVRGLENPATVLAHLDGGNSESDSALRVELTECLGSELFGQGGPQRGLAGSQSTRTALEICGQPQETVGQRTGKDRRPVFGIESDDVGERDTRGEGAGDDTAGAGADDEVEPGVFPSQLRCASDPAM